MDCDLKRVRELLQRGADKNITDNSGHTPADKAALLGDLDILAVLKS
jgi:ankyrin repeat protein